MVAMVSGERCLLLSSESSSGNSKVSRCGGSGRNMGATLDWRPLCLTLGLDGSVNRPDPSSDFHTELPSVFDVLSEKKLESLDLPNTESLDSFEWNPTVNSCEESRFELDLPSKLCGNGSRFSELSNLIVVFVLSGEAKLVKVSSLPNTKCPVLCCWREGDHSQGCCADDQEGPGSWTTLALLWYLSEGEDHLGSS